jgi:short-subunit dehydrogenase
LRKTLFLSKLNAGYINRNSKFAWKEKMATAKSRFSHVVITGASSGIGEALAYAYALPGMTLSLTGRDAGRLEAVAKTCGDKGALVYTGLIDVTQEEQMASWLKEQDARQAVDLVVANAGISGGRGVLQYEEPGQIRQIFAVNVDGVMNTVKPLLPVMLARRRGQVALVSSLAGFRGWPGAPGYCASKAAVKVYGEGLRGALAGSGVGVSVICPGFVVSRMTAKNVYTMPFLIGADKAAEIIRKGLEKNRGRIAFPWQSAFLAWGIGVLPDVLAGRLLKKTPAKAVIE